MEHQGLGLLACDEELFERVWGRVSAAPPQELPPPPAPQEAAEPPQSAPACPAALIPAAQPAADLTAAALQQWTLRLLGDGAAYAALARRTGRGRETLAALGREKRQHARSLAAEYFLRTGVRYWPEGSAPARQELPLLPSLRAMWAAERRHESALRAQAAQEELELANLYLTLADDARAASHRLRALLEAVW